MKCAFCNNESLSPKAKYCNECGNRLFLVKNYCSNCGNKILYKQNFCTECGKKINYIINDSKSNIYTKEKVKEDIKKDKYDNKGDEVNMENNMIKENYLEVLPNQSIIKSENKNVLPTVKNNNNLLLPVIVKNRELALIEIKEELHKLNKNTTMVGILKFVKSLVCIVAKLIKSCLVVSASVIGFVGVSILVVMTTAIITKNVVNTYYGIQTEKGDTTYSIFQIKDDKTQTQYKKYE